MLNTIQDAVQLLLPAKRKTSASGWTSFNAVCCHHNGERADTRGRGGLVTNSDGGVSYHCFNCNFKASYQPGRHLTFKFRKLLSWFGADENTVRRLVIDAIRVKELIAPEELEKVAKEEAVFKPRPLPKGAMSIESIAVFLKLRETDEHEVAVPDQLVKAVDYLSQRKINLRDYAFYLTDDQAYNLHKRVVVPFTWKNEIIGYTARAFEDGVKPKYHNSHEPNYVFNVDRQRADSKFVIVTEGPFDAMAIDGVAVLSNECSEAQADIIDSLGREVILVPDFDLKEIRGREVWAGSKLVEQAIEYGWTVSFPIWRDQDKDVSAAVEKYGKLFVLKTILDGRETSRLKIELMRKRIHN